MTLANGMMFDLNDLLYVFGSPATVVRLSIYVDLKLA